MSGYWQGLPRPHPRHYRRSVSRSLSRPTAFAGAAFTLAMIFAASASPIPLYARYRADAGLTDSQVAMSAVAYFIAVLAALLILARLSDHLGRRPVILAALALAAAGTLAFADMHSLWVMLAARSLQGLACGMASSALAAYVIDLAPPRPVWLGPAVTSTGPLVGLTIGAVLSGALAQYGHTLIWQYVIVVALLVVAALVIRLSPETAKRAPGVARSLQPRVRVPEAARPLLPIAAAVFVATWGVGAFYQAFSPLLAVDYLGSSNLLVAAAIFASYMAPGVLGSPLAGLMPSDRAQRVGMVAFLLGIGGLLVALRLGSVPLFVLASVLAGTAQALASTGTIGGLVRTATAPQLAGLLSAIFLISYTGAAVPGFLAGRLAAVLGTPQILAGFAGLTAVSTAIVLLRSTAAVPRPTAGRSAASTPRTSSRLGTRPRRR